MYQKYRGAYISIQRFGARADTTPALGHESDSMDIEATQKYFTDIGVDLSDVSALIASTIVSSPTMGQVKQEEFVKGWSDAK
jgi:hypothetical protein